MLLTIATGGSVLGAILVSRGNTLYANAIWSLTNIIWLWHAFSIGETEMCALFSIYEMIALYRIYHLRKEI